MADLGKGDQRYVSSLRLSASVIPALVAWLALQLPAFHGLLTMSLAFVLLLIGDLFAVRRG